MPNRSRKASSSPLTTGLRVLVTLLSIALTLAGMWVASSVAVYLNGPTWLAVAAGVAILLVPPFLSELWHRREVDLYGPPDGRSPPRLRRWLFDTLRINAILAVALMCFAPKIALTAISTRGDWMLESLSAETAEGVRGRLLAVADRLESLASPRDNPFESFDDSNTVEPKNVGWSDPPPAPEPPPPEPIARVEPPEVPSPPGRRATNAARPAPKDRAKPPPPRRPPAQDKRPPVRERKEPIDPPPPPPQTEPPRSSSEGTITRDPDHDVPLIVVRGNKSSPPPRRPTPPKSPPPPRPRKKRADHDHYVRWLAVPKPHRLVQNMPAAVETSYASVARYIQEREPDPFEKVKAIHDYIATRIDYKADFVRTRLPPSDPETVFRTRLAVCAGYARLFKAMMESLGEKAVYISGEARLPVPGTSNASHAWNAVEVEGRWYLLDVTWSAGTVENGRFKRKYRTEHLMPPPSFFVNAHFPRDPRWQLLNPPLSHGEFLRQPLLLPRFHAYGFELLSPSRSQVTVDGTAEVEIDNPREHSVLVSYAPKSAPTGRRERCTVDTQRSVSAATCQMPNPGEYVMYVFAAYRGRVRHELVARFDINNRG